MKNGRRKKRIIIGAAILLATCAALYFANPELRVRRFVAAHGEEIEESMAAGHGISARIGIKYFNTGEGEHDMTEFILFTMGDTYYGCYYSPDDVPLAFQNTDMELSQDGHDYWEWQAEGDNHGATEKIRDHWYYFEASF